MRSPSLVGGAFFVGEMLRCCVPPEYGGDRLNLTLERLDIGVSRLNKGVVRLIRFSDRLKRLQERPNPRSERL